MKVRVNKHKLAEKLLSMREEYPAAFRAALLQEAMLIFTASQELVPVDTGRLRASGGVSPPMGPSGTVVIYFGANYALAVHELHSSKGKYLEIPFKQALPGLAARMAKRTELLAARGVGIGRSS